MYNLVQCEFFFFRCNKWVINTRRDDLLVRMKKNAQEATLQLNKSNVLCAHHFEDSQFMNRISRNSLVHDAIPTKFEISNPPKLVDSKRKQPKDRPYLDSTIKGEAKRKKILLEPEPEQIPSTSKEPTPICNRPTLDPMTPRKKKLTKKIDSFRKKLKRRDSAIHLINNKNKEKNITLCNIETFLSKYLSGTCLNFVLSQIKMTTSLKHGRRWTPKLKSLAISLFHSSPRTYRLFRKIFCLPSVSTLKRCIKNINLSTGFNNNLVTTFKEKVKKMSSYDRLCTLCFDEMSIKEFVSYNSQHDRIDGLEDFGDCRTQYVSNHATVFMVRGIVGPWKQPIGYFFSSGPIKDEMLSSLIIDCLKLLQGMNLQVKALICDQGSNNRSALSELGLSLETPYILSSVDSNEKVYVIYDPPHLLKNIRNNLKNNGFIVDNEIVSWNHIQEFYNQDTKLPVRMAPKLTKKHIDLPPFSTLRVKYAAQVLSHSVYAGINTMVTFKTLPTEALVTANFLKRFDSLFNCFNIKKPKSKKPYNHAMTVNSNHHDFLKECEVWLSSVKSRSKRSLPCLQGWQIAIKSLNLLFQELAASGVKYLLTSRLNQDCLENLFSIIRGKGGNRDNPSVNEFRVALHQTMVDMLFKTTKNKNCEDDVDHFLINLPFPSSASTNTPEQNLQEYQEIYENESHHQDASLGDKVNLGLNLQNENVIAYISGFIVKKLKNKLCNNCLANISGSFEDTNLANLTLLKNKMYSDDCTIGLQIPSQIMINICTLLENKYNRFSKHLFHSINLRKQLFWKLKKSVDQELNLNLFVCDNTCEVLNQIINLFITIRLHHSLKLFNQEYAKTNKRRNRKIMKLNHE